MAGRGKSECRRRRQKVGLLIRSNSQTSLIRRSCMSSSGRRSPLRPADKFCEVWPRRGTSAARVVNSFVMSGRAAAPIQGRSSWAHIEDRRVFADTGSPRLSCWPVSTRPRTSRTSVFTFGSDCDFPSQYLPPRPRRQQQKGPPPICCRSGARIDNGDG
jgi:hypothetical protein